MAIVNMENIAGAKVYIPTGEIDAQARRLAPRPQSLRGARVGILDNHKEFADIVLGGVADTLKREYGVKEVTYWKKSYLGIPSPYAKEMAAACDVVINGVGHCGSSTPWTARDGVELENLGVATATIISTEFAALAQVTGQGAGHESLPLVLVPHPVGDRDENLVRQRGEDIVEECVRVLTTPVDNVTSEFAGKHYPVTASLMPRNVRAKTDTPVITNPEDRFEAVNDYFYERDWTDGLPIVPPTEARVQAMLAGMPWRNADELINVVPPKMGNATMRQIAVNAVMAGCKPEYLPVVVAALQAVSEPKYGLMHRQTTTHAGAPLIIVNGPIVQKLGINCGTGLFGPGWRANATIGRALRLILINVGGARPGVDLSQTGHPGKYTYCIGEYEAANPWQPLHVERGYRLEQSVVTVVNAEAPHSMTENVQTDPVEMMRTFASCMATLGGNNLYSQGNPVLVMGIENAHHIAAAGWSKQDVQRTLFEMARHPWGVMKNRGKSKGPNFPEFVDQNDDNSMVPIVSKAEDLIVVIGGGAGGKSMFLPTAGGQSLSVSKPIEESRSGK